MKNFVSDGRVWEHTNATSTIIASGDVVLMSNTIGVAVADIAASGGSGSVQVEGVFNLKAAAGAWVQGDHLYWDASASAFTKTASGNTLVAVAAATKASAAVLGDVKLNAAN